MFQGRGIQFEVLRFPVLLSPWFFLVALFGLRYLEIGLSYFLVWVGVAFFSVLVHELGHAVVMRRYSQEPRIVLQGFVGLTYGSAPYRSRREDITTSLAGPLTQILLLGVPAWLLRRNVDFDSSLLNFTIDVIWWVSFIWGFINLLPILPLDGGHIAQALWGRAAARRISVAASAVAVVYLLSTGRDFWLFFILLGGFSAWEIYQETHSSSGARVVLLPPSPGEYGGGYGGGDYGPSPKGRRRSGGARPPTRKGGRFRASHLQAVPDSPAELVGSVSIGPPAIDKIEKAVWGAIREGDLDAARRALAKLPEGAPVDLFLRPSLDLVAGDTAEAVGGFEAAYVARPEGPSGLLPASLIGQHGEARVLAVRILGHQGAGPAFAVSSLQGHLHYARHYAQSATVGELLHADVRANKAQVAFEVACAWGRVGETDHALRWVEAAIVDGFDSGTTLDREADLVTVRADPAWVSVRALLS
ncbi:MAG: site-2 protease family protein [Acidimicrobiia bacterium]|nr:site-2 protease family protein [Acidimicrobiia bacterium]